jgi:hypothetical protein
MRNTLKKAWKNEFVQGGAFFMVSFTLANVINLFFTFIAGRLLGPSGYGEITALMSYLMLASVPLTVITTIVTQKVSESDENAGSTAYIIEHFIWKTMRKYWYLAALTVVVIPFIPILTNMSFETSMFLVPLFWALFVFSIYGAFAQGMRLFLMYSILTVISPGIKLLGPVISQYSHNGLLTVLFFLFLSFFIPFIWIYREFIAHAKKNSEPAKPLEKRIMHIIANKQLVLAVLQYQIDVQTPFDIVFTALISRYPSGTIYQPALLSPQQAVLQGLETKRLEVKGSMDSAITSYNNATTNQTDAATATAAAQAANDNALAVVGTTTQAVTDLTSAAQTTLDTATAAEATANTNYTNDPTPENKTALDAATQATVDAQAALTAIEQGQPYLTAVSDRDTAVAAYQTANQALLAAQAAQATAASATQTAKTAAHAATQAYLTAVTNCQTAAQTYLTAVTNITNLITAQEAKLEAKLATAQGIQTTATTNLTTYGTIVTSVTAALAALA